MVPLQTLLNLFVRNRWILAGVIAVGSLGGCQHGRHHWSWCGDYRSASRTDAHGYGTGEIWEFPVPQEGHNAPPELTPPAPPLLPAPGQPILPRSKSSPQLPPDALPPLSPDPVTEPIDKESRLLPRMRSPFLQSIRSKVSGWTGRDQARAAQFVPERRLIETAQPVRLAPPPEIYHFQDGERTRQNPNAGQAYGSNSPSGPLDLTPEPSRMAAPPVLQSLPAGPHQQIQHQNKVPDRAGPVSPAGLSIGRITVCREVRSYEDVTEIDPRSLKPGQPLLIYATLENFRSLPTAEGHRTLTLSTLEVRTASGALVTRQPLGTAADLARSPRRDYFLTHHVTIPAEMPAGEYVFTLCVYDLVGEQLSQAELPVVVRP